MWFENEELRKMEHQMEVKEGEARGETQKGRKAIELVLTGRFPNEFGRFAATIKEKLVGKTSTELDPLILAGATCGSVQEFVALL